MVIDGDRFKSVVKSEKMGHARAHVNQPTVCY